jgi:hypothetical protein
LTFADVRGARAAITSVVRVGAAHRHKIAITDRVKGRGGVQESEMIDLETVLRHVVTIQ